jgi:hypothetical protein
MVRTGQHGLRQLLNIPGIPAWQWLVRNSVARAFPVFIAGLAIALTGCNTFAGSKSSPSLPPDPDKRADLLASQMTQDEKLQLVHGNIPLPPYPTPPPHGAAYWVQGIPRLGIPDILSADGPGGPLYLPPWPTQQAGI